MFIMFPVCASYISYKIMAPKPYFHIFDFFSKITSKWHFILRPEDSLNLAHHNFKKNTVKLQDLDQDQDQFTQGRLSLGSDLGWNTLISRNKLLGVDLYYVQDTFTWGRLNLVSDPSIILGLNHSK